MTSRQVRPQYTEAPYRRGSKPSDERSLSAFVDEELKKIEQAFAVLRTQMSFTYDGSGFKLVGDQASPGVDMVYGTDGSGVKGWKPGSGGGGGSGPQGVPGRPGFDGIDGEDSYIPGPQGPAGASGAAGAPGAAGRPGLDGIDGEDSYVPGPQGPQGPAGAAGSPGPTGPAGPALAYILDPAEPDVLLIPGPQGPKGDTGASGGGGGGVGGTGTTTVNFGAFPGTSDTLVTITGQAGIVAGSVVQAWIQPAATADHSADEHWIETIQVTAGNIVPGVGFTIYARNTSELNEPLEDPGAGRNHISTGTAAANTGYGATGRRASVGGRGTRLYGAYNVAWLWN